MIQAWPCAPTDVDCGGSVFSMWCFGGAGVVFGLSPACTAFLVHGSDMLPVGLWSCMIRCRECPVDDLPTCSLHMSYCYGHFFKVLAWVELEIFIMGVSYSK